MRSLHFCASSLLILMGCGEPPASSSPPDQAFRVEHPPIPAPMAALVEEPVFDPAPEPSLIVVDGNRRQEIWQLEGQRIERVRIQPDGTALDGGAEGVPVLLAGEGVPEASDPPATSTTDPVADTAPAGPVEGSKDGSSHQGPEDPSHVVEVDPADPIIEAVEHTEEVIEAQNKRAEDINEDLADIIDTLRAERGLPKQAPYVAPTDPTQRLLDPVFLDPVFLDPFRPRLAIQDPEDESREQQAEASEERSSEGQAAEEAKGD